MQDADQQHQDVNRSSWSKTRVDPAHVVQSGGEIPSDPYPSVPVSQSIAEQAHASDRSTAIFVEQVNKQATQLATRLQQQQSELDHREAALNARIAAAENEFRSARLWLDERCQELDEREAKINNSEQTLRGRLAEMGIVSQASSSDASLSDTLKDELNGWAKDQQERQAELNRLQEELVERQNELDQQVTQVELRRRYLDKAGNLFSEERAGFAEASQELEKDRVEQEQQQHQAREQIAADKDH